MTEDDYEIDDLIRPPSAIVGPRFFVWACPLCTAVQSVYEVLPDRPTLIECFGCGFRMRDGQPMLEPPS